MSTLTLILKKEWFDKIKSGEKTVEYREAKPYWRKRLERKKFTEIIFKNGYGKNAPSLKANFHNIEEIWGSDTDLGINEWVFAIQFYNVEEVL